MTLTFPLDRLRAVFFDLDDTLLDHRGAARASLNDLCSIYADFFGLLDFMHVHAAWNAINEAIWEEYSRGVLTSGELQTQRSQQLIDWVRSMRGPVPGPDAHELSAAYLEHYQLHCALFDGALPLVRQLAGRYRLGIITNGFQIVQQRKLQGTGLADHFDHVIVSESVGAHKPDPAIFRIALDAARVEASEAVYIGDNYMWDVRGSAHAGMASVWYNPNGAHMPAEYADVQPNAIVRSPGDLATLFGLSLESIVS